MPFSTHFSKVTNEKYWEILGKTDDFHDNLALKTLESRSSTQDKIGRYQDDRGLHGIAAFRVHLSLASCHHQTDIMVPNGTKSIEKAICWTQAKLKYLSSYK